MATGADRSGRAPLPSVLAAVRAAADLELAEELDRRIARPPRVRPVHVTQLLEPRAAYYRLVHPVPVDAGIADRRYRGRLRHEQIERWLAGPEEREVRLVRDGIVGQVDLYRGRPTEVKTTGRVPPASSLARERPQYVDQVGMYCALADTPEGRLVVAGYGNDPHRPQVVVLECTFDGLATLRAGMAEEAERWREALVRRDPSALPVCPWFERGCEFRRAAVCGCTGREPEPTGRPSSRLTSARSDEEASRSLAAHLAEGASDAADFAVRSYRELLYPRRGYFERTCDPDPEASARALAAPSDEASIYRSIQTALEADPDEGLLRRASAPPAPEERTLFYRGDPLLIKSTRSRRPPRPDDLARASPAAVLELGLRCAAFGREEGRLVVAHEMLAPDEEPVRAYRLRFEPLASWTGELAERCERFSAALAEGRPEGLGGCPDWMVAGCPYLSRCGEGPSESSRDQR